MHIEKKRTITFLAVALLSLAQIGTSQAQGKKPAGGGGGGAGSQGSEARAGRRAPGSDR